MVGTFTAVAFGGDSQSMIRNAPLELDVRHMYKVHNNCSKKFVFPTTLLNTWLNSTDSAKRVATRALAATSRNIKLTAAPPTLEQARVMGVESVVEGVEWNFSTEQLKARSVFCTTQQYHGEYDNLLCIGGRQCVFSLQRATCRVYLVCQWRVPSASRRVVCLLLLWQ